MILDHEIPWMVLARATLVLTCVAIISQLLSRRSAAVRHAIWAISLICLPLLVPASGLLPPIWQPTLSISSPQPYAPEELIEADHPQTSESEIGLITSESGSELTPVLRPAVSSAQPPNHFLRQPVIPATTASQLQKSAPFPSLDSVLSTIWFLGCVLLSVRLLIGLFRTWSFVRTTTTATDHSIRTLMGRLASRLNLSFTPSIRMHTGNIVPITAGLFRPCIVLPASAVQWPESRLEAVLIHELAHIRRFDTLTQTLSQFSVILFWFHPLAWLGLHQLRREQEYACDDLVVCCGVSPIRYAEELRTLALDSLGPGLGFAIAEVSRRGTLEQRVRSILNSDVLRSHVPLRRRSLAILMIAVTCVACGLCMVQPVIGVAEESDELPLPPPPTEFIPENSSPEFTEPRSKGPFVHELKVIDQSGKPVTNATISPTGFGTGNGVGWSWLNGVWPAHYSTNREGVASIELSTEQLNAIPRETGQITFLSFTVEHPEFAAEHRPTHFVRDTAPIVLSAGHVIEPVVLDPDGQELQSGLYAISSGYPRLEWTMKEGRLRSGLMGNTDGANRYFRIVHVPADRLDLRFSSMIDAATLPTESRVLSPTISVAPGVSLSGALSQNVPRPIAAGGYVVAAIREGGNGSGISWQDVTEVTPEGTFSFESLPPNSHVEVSAIIDGWISQPSTEMHHTYDQEFGTNFSQFSQPGSFVSTPVRIEDQPVSISLQMAQSGTIEFEVVDTSGNPLPDAMIYISPCRVTRNGSIPLNSTLRSIDYLVSMEPSHESSGGFHRTKTSSFTWTRLSDAHGRAVIKNLPAASELVQCVLPGYLLVPNIHYIAGIDTFVANIVPGRKERIQLTMRKSSAPVEPAIFPQQTDDGFHALQFSVFDQNGYPVQEAIVRPVRHSLLSSDPVDWPSDWPSTAEQSGPGEFLVKYQQPSSLQQGVPPRGSIWVSIQLTNSAPISIHEIEVAHPRPIRK
ncbi:MAG: M56 family metallopeptidase [Planctomyces sp.]|nr:M56 family metallopeptidase [Planctomyces sp.]